MGVSQARLQREGLRLGWPVKNGQSGRGRLRRMQVGGRSDHSLERKVRSWVGGQMILAGEVAGVSKGVGRRVVPAVGVLGR